MQEQEETKKDIPMVDIDTSGEGAEIELEDKAQESEDTNQTVETKEEDPSPASQETSGEEQEAKSEEEKAEAKNEKKEELENYSKDVQRRIAKLTKKWREAQRQADEALAFAKSQQVQKESIEKKYSSVEQASVKDREARIKAALDSAQVKLAAAREAGDISAEVEANKQIAMLGYEEARLAEAKVMAEETAKIEKPKKEVPTLENVPQTVNADPKAEAWGSKNRWFGTDTAMTYTAFDIHDKLVNQEGYEPSSDEYYAEIDKRIRLEFPHKFDTNSDKAEKVEQSTTTKPVQQVASATRSTKPGRKTVRLTPSQVAIAKKLGVPLEEYAKQLNITKEV